MKKFVQFIKESEDLPQKTDTNELISESSFLNKSFSLVQGSKHQSLASNQKNIANNLKNLASRGKSEIDISKKLDIFFNVVDEISQSIRHEAGMSVAIMNVAVASTVLSHDVKKELELLYKKLNKK